MMMAMRVLFYVRLFFIAILNLYWFLLNYEPNLFISQLWLIYL